MPLIARLWVCAAIACASSAPTTADELEFGGTKIERIGIVDLEGAEIAYRTPAGDFRYLLLTRVDRIYVDSAGELEDLNEAEALRVKRDFVRAINHYERALRVSTGFWKRLVRARLIQACDQSDHIDKFARQFILLLRDTENGAALAAELMPHHAPTPQSRGIPRAKRDIAEVVRGMRSQSGRVLLDMLAFHIATRAAPGESARLAIDLVRQPIPPLIATREVYRIKRRALGLLLDGGKAGMVLDIIDGELADAPMPVLPEMLLIKARALEASAKTDEDRMRAAWAALRVVIHYADDELAPEALLLASEVHEQIGRAPIAAQLIEECLGHAQLTAAVRKQAEERMERLRSTG